MASWFDQWNNGGGEVDLSKYYLDPSRNLPNYTGGSTGNTGINGGADWGGNIPIKPTTAGVSPIPAAGMPSGGMFPAGNLPPNLPGATPGAAPAGGSITMQQFNEAWMGSPYPGTVQGLKDFMAAHPEYAAAGITLGGSKGDKVYQNGQYWGDYVISAGAGGLGKSVGNGQAEGGGATGGAPGAGGVVPGNYLDPYTTPFSMPTLEELQNSPGYQARLQEGLHGVETSAFAKGTGLTTGTIKKLNRYGQDYASGEYNNLYAQKYGVNQGNAGLFYANQTNPFTKLSDLSKIGFPQ